MSGFTTGVCPKLKSLSLQATDTVAFAAPGTFVDTGIDIFVREKDDGTWDRSMSVFAAELPAGTYVFGAMDSGKNFYTIGAVPAQ